MALNKSERVSFEFGSDGGRERRGHGQAGEPHRAGAGEASARAVRGRGRRSGRCRRQRGARRRGHARARHHRPAAVCLAVVCGSTWKLGRC